MRRLLKWSVGWITMLLSKEAQEERGAEWLQDVIWCACVIPNRILRVPVTQPCFGSWYWDEFILFYYFILSQLSIKSAQFNRSNWACELRGITHSLFNVLFHDNRFALCSEEKIITLKITPYRQNYVSLLNNNDLMSKYSSQSSNNDSDLNSNTILVQFNHLVFTQVPEIQEQKQKYTLKLESYRS